MSFETQEPPGGVCLVGLGPHAKHLYMKLISKYQSDGRLRHSYLVELSDKKADVLQFIRETGATIDHLIFVEPTKQRAPEQIDAECRRDLSRAIEAGEISYAIISTEPKAHRAYIEFFLEKKIPVLTDKPLTAPIGSNKESYAAAQIFRDALELNRISANSETPLYILTQRREHPAFQFVFSEIEKVVESHSLPITYFDIFSSDGTWSMPDEFATRENHPYKYGYGKLLHSGYHSVDLVAWIAEVNARISRDLHIQLRADILSPQGQYDQLNGSSLYQKLFDQATERPANLASGEVDAYCTFRMIDEPNVPTDTRPLSFGRLDLLQGGFTRRAWFGLPEDTYKGNGRVRHERVVLNVGPLMSVHLHSYQVATTENSIVTGVGSTEHIEVHVFRNSDLISGKPLSIYDFGSDIMRRFGDRETFLGQNEIGREAIFEKFISLERSSVQISDQLFTNRILSEIFLSLTETEERKFGYR